MNELTGYRILNTRPKAQAASLTAALETLGATVVELPLLTISPTSHWRKKPLNLTSFNYAVFTSPNAVTYFFEHVLAKNWPIDLPIISIGQGTSRALHALGLSTSLSPEEANSESLLTLPELQRVKNANILLVKGVGGRAVLAKTLRARGAKLHTCAVYRRICPKNVPFILRDLWQKDALDMIIVTSATALRYLFQCAEHEAMRHWLSHKYFFVLSGRIGRAVKHENIRTMVITSYDNLINRLKDFSHERRQR